MVGNPTGYRITLDKDLLQVRDGTQVQSFQQAATQATPIVFRGINVFDARISGVSKYFEPPTLAKWNGCWIMNLTPRPLTLLIPPAEGTTTNARVAASSEQTLPWLVSIDAASDGQLARVEIGLATTGRASFDRHDAYAPPPMPGVDLAMGLRLAGQDGAVERGELLERDVRARSEVAHRWTLEVVSKAELELSWTTIAGDPAAVTTLELERGERRHDMSVLRTLRLPAGRHTLHIHAGSDRSPTAPPPVLRASANPNPFRAETTFSYTVPGAGAVLLRVYDVAGRLVWSHDVVAVDMGEHALVWNGHDAGGSPVPAGTYFMRVEHRPHGAGGSRGVAVHKLTRVR
jgi:hypothetical protein